MVRKSKVVLSKKVQNFVSQLSGSSLGLNSSPPSFVKKKQKVVPQFDRINPVLVTCSFRKYDTLPSMEERIRMYALCYKDNFILINY